MEHVAFKDTDSFIDLESGEGTTSDEEDVSKESDTSPENLKTLFAKVYNTFGKHEDHSCDSAFTFSEAISAENPLKNQEREVVLDKETSKETRKKKNTNKSSKPPRPPRGPSLDAADKLLIREINEHALLKRAKIEREKALKKMKAASPKPSSTFSNSNIFAMVFTILFFLVMFLQGMSTRTSPASFHGSPESAAGSDNNFISVKYYPNPSSNDINDPNLNSPSSVEQIFGRERREING